MPMLRLNMTKVLKKARSQGAKSVADVARQTGITHATLSRLAAGHKEPSLGTVWRIRAVYGGHVETYVYEDPQATRGSSVPRQRKAPAKGQLAT
ncbi:helix-turn-helix domain-containing protein [Streptomyces cylindrosporus]|uniref:Helix-turn-helix domain-containing protein n=1 Tax=Streptomyces cylindrosporus TaxID=2927583 RepID=A0ABS9YKX5_9ACTN|nr:helix-turn-helix transcriptional regulator [Streptomyces cylindrosporus]MCI3277559.1 helix-turn-helix domain-containing protein [Streptomyces cylindrosporus]